MSLENNYVRNIDVSNGEHQDEASIIDSIANATAPLSTARIHRVPTMVRATEDYEKHYVPKVVSIGPYHYGNPKLEFIEKLKPVFTMKLLSDNKETLRSLYKTLGEAKMVQELKDFYEEKSISKFNDKVFTKMMLLDGCFILYYIQHIFGGKHENCLELKTHLIVFVHQDIFLLENQIPYKVLDEVMKLVPVDRVTKFKPFIDGNIMACGRPKKRWLCFNVRNDQRGQSEFNVPNDVDHLLHLLHLRLTKNNEISTNDTCQTNDTCTFRNVNELMDVGIHFEPSGDKSLARVEFDRAWWCWSAEVKLPPISVDDSTKPMLLNLIAYEMCTHGARDPWVTSYICLLDSLIDHPEDVKTLRKSGVLDNSLGSDKEVAKLFNEIGTDLVPNNLAYLDAKNKIQKHYESRRNTLLSQLKHEYVKSPWAFFALLGALMALFLSGVQTYFTVWSPESPCDNLCMFLKRNHHL